MCQFASRGDQFANILNSFAQRYKMLELFRTKLSFSKRALVKLCKFSAHRLKADNKWYSHFECVIKEKQ